MDFTPMMSADGHEEASLQWKIPNLKRVMASQQKNPMRFVRQFNFPFSFNASRHVRSLKMLVRSFHFEIDRA
jgi:hypothetical protein